MKPRFLIKLLAMALLAFHVSGQAEDIDLFYNTAPITEQLPNVLLVVDNTANWNQQVETEFAALASTIGALPPNKFRVGIIMFAQTGAPNNNTSGGYVRAALRTLDTPTKAKYQALISSFSGDDKGNGGDGSLAMAEAYLYLSAGTPYAGNYKAKADYLGNTFNNTTQASRDVWAQPGNALDSFGATRYNTPVTSACQKNFIIYLSNSAAQDSTNGLVKATDLLRGALGDTSTIPLSPSGSQDSMTDEWARFMKKSDLQVVTYTIDVNPKTTGQGPGWTANLKSMARVSDGKYFAVNATAASAAEVVDALNAIFSEIQSVNSVFASVSLPVSVNTQGTYLNQVFVGMFRPASNAYPRWNGNLKQYKMGYYNGELEMLDADGRGAINKLTGFVTECARSFWTPAAKDQYWAFKSPGGGCLTVADSAISNYPDGNIVEKGAQAYQLRNATSRPVKTCSPSGCTEFTDFNSTNVTQTMLGAPSSAEHLALIAWARGADNLDENGNENLTEMRPSSHGDIVHSRPVAVNYGTDVSPQVVVFYGGNDGMLRAINGNRSTSVAGYAAGAEMWGFMPPEFYRHVKRIRDNNIQIDYKGPDAVFTESRLPKPYGVDGSVTAYIHTYPDASGAETKETWIFAGMRRGGRAFYAIDVTNPASPRLKWRQGCLNPDDDTNCSPGFSGIGQTWSSLKAFKASGYEGGAKPLLIAGGGYDKCEDSDPNSCTGATKGNKIYVLDADDGSPVRTMDTDRSVVADVFVIQDAAGMATHAYAADLGGNVYRITMGAAAPADWTIRKIASLGCDTVAGCTANRKFIYHPDVVKDNESYILLIGSGDREKPIMSYTAATSVQNHFFMIKDRPTDAGWLLSETANCDGSAVICKNSLLALPDENTAASSADLNSKKGWYLNLRPTEQVVTSAITVYGTVTFSTHQPLIPTAGTCAPNLGTARAYNLDYATGVGRNVNSRSEMISGGGLPPSPIAGKVTLDDGSTTVPFIIGSKADSPLKPGEPPVPGVATQPKSRVYWYIRQ